MNDFKYIVNKSLKPYRKCIPDITKPVLRAIIKVCVCFLETKKYSKDIYDRELHKLTNNGVLLPDNHNEMFAATMIFITTVLSWKKNEDFKSILSDFQFRDECIEDIVKVIENHRVPLSIHFYDMKSLQNPIDKMEYRINISFNSSQPSVILHIHEKNGSFKTIELNMQLFHRLRLVIASVLAEIQLLNNRQIMKI